MSKPNPYYNAAQQRMLQVILTLFGNEITGLTPTEISRAVGCTSSTMTKDLWNLSHAGLAEQLPTGRYRLTARFPQCAMAMLDALDKAERHLAETKQRFTRAR